MLRNTRGGQFDSESARAGGVLLVAAACLLSAAPVHGEDVRLVTGDLIRGPIVERTDEMMVVEHPVLGRMDIRMDQVDSITPTPPPGTTPPPDPAAGRVQVSSPPPPAEPDVALEEEKEWDFSLNIAGNGSWGNTDEQSFRVGFTGEAEREETRLNVDAAYSGDLTNGDTTDNNFTAGFVHDWLVPESPWFYFAQSRFDYDQFESWDERISAHGGAGYELIDNDIYQLAVKGGPGVRREFGSNNDSWLFEAVFGLRFGWKISERSSFNIDSQYLPAVDDWMNDYRLLTNANFELKLDPELSLSLVSGVRHEYQNIVNPDTDRNNTTVFVGVQYDF